MAANVTQNAANGLPLDVHVVPVLREADRALLPFLPRDEAPPLLHAHRIHLVVAPDETAQRLAPRLERQLKRWADVRTIHVRRQGRTDFEALLETFASLIRSEVESGHRVHVNVSSGSKMAALAVGVAAMAHLPAGAGGLYYVRPEGYRVSAAEFEEHGASIGLAAVQPLEVMPLLMPSPVQSEVLGFLRGLGGEADYRRILQHLGRVPGSGYDPSGDRRALRRRRWTNTVTTRMVRSVLTPLQERGLVEIRDAGRQKQVRLTARGALYAALAARGGMPTMSTTSTHSFARG